eukprot:372004_1
MKKLWRTLQASRSVGNSGISIKASEGKDEKIINSDVAVRHQQDDKSALSEGRQQKFSGTLMMYEEHLVTPVTLTNSGIINGKSQTQLQEQNSGLLADVVSVSLNNDPETLIGRLDAYMPFYGHGEDA